MIQMQTMLDVADNTGAKTARCIKVLGSSRRRYAGLGDIIVVAVQKVLPNGAIKHGQVVKGVIVRTKKETRLDGTTLRGDDLTLPPLVSDTQNLTRATAALTYQSPKGFFIGGGLSWTVPRQRVGAWSLRR